MKHFYLVVIFSFLTLAVQAQIITQWNFNGLLGLGTTTPSIGTGSVANVGGATSSFASGSGSSDPALLLNSADNLTSFPAAGTNNKSAGLEIRVSTAGKQNIKLSFDLRLSASAAKMATIQYSTNGGTNWVDFSTITIAAATTWVNGNTVDFSSITALNNNANARFRVVSTMSGSGGTAYEGVSGAYSTSGTYRFDMVTVQGTDIPLPVTYSGFNARYTESKTVAITWATSLEHDNAHFDVERSADIESFQLIGRVDGKGTSDAKQQYSFIDEAPMAGWNYYRLKQVDIDGKTSYSKLVAVLNETTLTGDELNLSPNPADRDLTIRINSSAKIGQVMVYTMQGHQMSQSTSAINQLDVSALPAGIYILEVRTTDNRVLRQRFVKR
jgi:hypothetical protein